MYYGCGMGRGSGRGYGQGMGFGFRGSSPPWPYVGIGRGGLPRCQAYMGYGAAGTGYPFVPWPWAASRRPYGAVGSPQEEIQFLKNQGAMLRKEIDAIDARIKELEKENPQGGER